MKTLFDDSLIAAALGTCVQETAPVLALWLEADGRVTEANAQARRVLEAQLGRRVHLFLFVKVRDNWIDDPDRFKGMGLDWVQ